MIELMIQRRSVVDNYISQAREVSSWDADENILFPMAALLYHNFEIVGACGGHAGRKTGGIYIDIAIPGYAIALEANALHGKNDIAIAHATARTKLALILLLNKFYTERRTKYEGMLVVTSLSKGVLRLQTMENDIIEMLASVDKRREWLVAANDEFFAFGQHLFEQPLSSSEV